MIVRAMAVTRNQSMIDLEQHLAFELTRVVEEGAVWAAGSRCPLGSSAQTDWNTKINGGLTVPVLSVTVSRIVKNPFPGKVTWIWPGLPGTGRKLTGAPLKPQVKVRGVLPVVPLASSRRVP